MGTILYPFDIELNNNQSFKYTINLANRVNLPVVMFTNLSPKIYHYPTLQEKLENLNKENIYYHILELKGYYMSFQENWKRVLDHNFIIRITEGNLRDELEKTIKEENATILVIDPQYAKKTRLSPFFLATLTKSLKVDFLISSLTDAEFLNSKNLTVLN